MITIPLAHAEALYRMYLMQLEFDRVEKQNEASYGKVSPLTFWVSL